MEETKKATKLALKIRRVRVQTALKAGRGGGVSSYGGKS